MSQNDYVYLDPHFVQESKFSTDKNYEKTYRVKGFRTLHETKVNPCIGLAFKVDNFKKFCRMRAKFEELQNKHKDSYYLCFYVNNDSY